jgi:DNA-binding IscR family transcriptional regulator
VIEAAEGPLFYNNCLVHGRPCEIGRDHWCPVHEIWEEAQRSFLATLERYSLEEMASRVSRWDRVGEALHEVLKKR